MIILALAFIVATIAKTVISKLMKNAKIDKLFDKVKVNLEVLTNIGSQIISCLPYAVSGLLMLGLAILLANYVNKIILKSFPQSKGVALAAKTLIIILGVFVTLYQLGIASQLVNNAFLIILGAVGVAFGVGGREFAAHMLNKVENKIDEKTNKKKINKRKRRRQ